VSGFTLGRRRDGIRGIDRWAAAPMRSPRIAVGLTSRGESRHARFGEKIRSGTDDGANERLEDFRVAGADPASFDLPGWRRLGSCYAHTPDSSMAGSNPCWTCGSMASRSKASRTFLSQAGPHVRLELFKLSITFWLVVV
jgi:hypothetical protein